MNQPLLSVIVPCYHVEKYMDKCISSIVGQTYTNLEILLVDDGSTDQTGALCDLWQEKDQRIRVIHKQNEGVSYARKAGVENATAEYITFVDADDWIDRKMYADMMTALLSTHSDIAHCDFCIVHEDGRIKHRDHVRDDTIKTIGRIEGVIMILENHKWRTSLFTKIFRKKLFDHVEFPKGRICGEDMIIHDLFHRASQTVFLDCAYYYYFQRTGSVTKVGNIQTEAKKTNDFFEAYQERYFFVKQHPEYDSALPHVVYVFINVGIHLLNFIMVYPHFFARDYFLKVSEQIRTVSLSREVTLRRGIKFKLYVLKFNQNLYKFLMLLYIRLVHITNWLKITNRITCSFFWNDKC